MKAIIKNRAGKVKYPARKEEVKKAIKAFDDETTYNAKLHYISKKTQNGNILIVEECDSLSWYPRKAHYVTPSFQILRRVSDVDSEMEYASTWETEWEIIAKIPLHERTYNIRLNPIEDLVENPCVTGVIGFLNSLDKTFQGESFLRWYRIYRLYYKYYYSPSPSCTLAEFIATRGFVYPNYIYLYGLSVDQISSLEIYFQFEEII